MANKEDNLIPFDSNQSREEAKKNGAKGGKRSGEVRRERKTMKAMLDYLLEKEITNKKGEKASTLEALMAATIKKAMSGDTRAVQFIRDTIGEMPTQKHELTPESFIQKVYITPEQQQETDKHIDDIIK